MEVRPVTYNAGMRKEIIIENQTPAFTCTDIHVTM